MPPQAFPFAVRLLGFSSEEAENFDAVFAAGQGRNRTYFRLAQDNLQDPDFYIADAAQLKALVALSDLRPGEVRPALLVGKPDVDLPYPHVERPLQPAALFAVLDALVEVRADALSRLQASEIVSVPERRRRPRLDLDLTDPAEYEKMRSKTPENGAALVVDRTPALHDYLVELLAPRRARVGLAADEEQAIAYCKRQPTAVVLINTSTPGIDPYRLCWLLKEKDGPTKTSVILLVGKQAEYDRERAKSAGAEGFLNKPLAGHQLVAVLKKFLPGLR